jgi:outer membrane protein
VAAGIVAFHNEVVTWSFTVSPEFMRLSGSSSPQLAGIKSRQFSINGGTNLAIREPWGDTSFAVLHDILDRNNGMLLRAQYGYPIPLGPGRLTPSVNVAWESSNLTNYYYGVSPAEARLGRPAYSPGSAVNPGASLNYNLPLGQTWRLNAGASYTRFGRSIYSSPIIDQNHTTGVMISFSHVFGGGH